MEQDMPKDLLTTYEERAKSLLKKTPDGKTWEDITKDATTYRNFVTPFYKNMNTRSAMLNLPLSLAKHGSKMVEGWDEKKIESFRFISDSSLRKRNELNEAEQEVKPYKDYDDMKSDVEKNVKNAEGRLMYALYFTQPPLRDDYTHMHVVDKLKDAGDKEHNYYVKSTGSFILNHYKTKATYGQAVVKASPDVRSAIRAYTQQIDTTILFPNVKSLTKKFKTFTGGYTINDVRHSYISNFLKTNPKPSEKRDIAERMLHSTQLQSTYERFVKEGDSSP